ncbi:unnamed protein product [Rotaria sordida]|uniref:AB hydrolase-1 domain-containing protein n=1 Tax=Rotaria sordida TaxID=392033 RepID=A0A818LMU6_9BILA|nr:unnamed protein product [Rotaria sordida]CAF0922152.1 unnamed protein product [Rotaria sordida]CAF0940607.1 unnamed protein product [Rotaria sordida]CAF3575098.1 unnamed protein product [Rotaria sordida]CAF3750424.1 unnamed protein product [Rotaria sordida]
MPYVKFSALNQNLELYYEVHGSGKIKILFIMGLLTEGASWNYQSEFFRQQSEYQCVTYDNRGCGRSSSPFTFQYTTTQMAKDALALIDHLKWTKCHIVGVSMGGMIALELVLLAPERILSLTLLATHAGGLAGRAPFVGMRHILRSLVIRDEHLLVENSLSMLYGPKIHGDPDKRKSFYDYHTERLKKRIRPKLIGILGHMLAVQRHYVGYADLLKIRYAPFDCLIMVGTEDRLVREANSYIIQRTLGCRLVKLEHAGHALPVECAKEINEELFDLFESIRTNNSSKVKREVPEEYKTEIKALEQCCQHRTHCLIYDIVGLIKGLFFGMILYVLLTIVGLTKGQFIGIPFTIQTVILIGFLNGLRRAIKCVYHAFHARRFVQKHQLLLDQAAHHGGIGVALPEEPKNGIPHGCGFEYPIHSIIFIISLIGFIYSTKIY